MSETVKQQQHQLLAIEKDAKTAMTKVLAEASKTFSSKPEHFVEMSKTYQPINDADNDRPDQEFVPMVTTVDDKLSYIRPYMERFIDILSQKEATNQVASADIILNDGTVIATQVSVSALLQFESIFAEIRNNVLMAIPTNDPRTRWTENNIGGVRTYIADRVETKRSVKVSDFITIDVGEKFPKEIKQVSKDQVVGTWFKDTKSGMLSPAAKSDILRRIDEIIEAIKKARAVANSTPVVVVKYGKSIFDYVFGK